MKLRIAKKVGRPGCFYTCATLRRSIRRLKKAVKAQRRFFAWPLPTKPGRMKYVLAVKSEPLSADTAKEINAWMRKAAS